MPTKRAELRPQRLDVAHLPQILADRPRRASRRRSRRARHGRGRPASAAAAASAAMHARQHGVVAALDARHVHEAGGAADQRAAREGELGHRLPAALGHRARAIGEALAAGEGVAHQRMRLEALELVERRQVRVRVVEVHDEADRHQVVVEVIEERAAAGVAVERPAERVLHQALAGACPARPATAPSGRCRISAARGRRRGRTWR